MKAKVIIAMIVFGTLIAIIILNFTGIFSPLNKNFMVKVNKHCFVDADCVIKSTSCSPCECGEAVYRDWEQICPFQKPTHNVLCSPCDYVDKNMLRCISSECTIVK